MQISSTSKRCRSDRPVEGRSQIVSDLARAVKSPGLLEAEDSRFEFLVSHRRAARPAGRGSRRAMRRTERSERPVSSAISEICRPCSRSSSTRLPKGSSSERTRSSSSANARASSGVGSGSAPDEASPSSTRSSGTLDVDRPAGRGLMPGLPEQLVPGDGRQQPPEVAAAAERVAALSRLDEEAAIDREHDVLGIGPPRQPGREPAPGQRGEPLEVAGEERLRGQVIAAAEPLQQDERRPGVRSFVRPHRSWLPCTASRAAPADVGRCLASRRPISGILTKSRSMPGRSAAGKGITWRRETTRPEPQE